MKKLIIATIVASVFLSSMAWGAHWLSGQVKYSNGTLVGPNKPVKVWLSTSTYETVYTRDDPEYGWYKYSFYPPKYFYKVSCEFFQSGKTYKGETMIDATLYGDTRYDITVYATQADTL